MLLQGYPVLAYSIAAVRQCPEIDRVIVTTDSQAIADIATSFGAEAPFLRPAELSQDRSPDIDYVRHAVQWLKDHESYHVDLVIQTRPTTPLRDPKLISAAMVELLRRPEATSLRSVHALSEPPQKMMGIENGYLVGLFPHDTRPEYFNLPRQAFAPAYHPNGYIDIVKTDCLAQSDSLYGPRIVGFVTPRSIEIDEPEDVAALERRLEQAGDILYDYLRREHPKTPALKSVSKKR